MKRIILYCFILLLNSIINLACNIEFDNIDNLNIYRNVYERHIFNISGQLQYCPSSLIIRNISLSNPILKRLSILNVTFFIQTNRINITGLARLVGFAPLTIQLYFQHDIDHRSIEYSIKNATNQQKQCGKLSSSDRNEILENCPMIKFEDGYYILKQTINVAVKRRQTIIDILFTSVVMFLVTAGTLCIGCGLEIEQLLNNFKRPIPLIVGLACQIIYLPLLAFAIKKIFQLDNSTSLGLISTASSPGGGSSNIYTALLRGDVDLSVTLTFLSTILAFGTFPLWIRLLGDRIIDFKKVKFPWWNMSISLLSLCLPAIIGLLLRRYRPVLAHRIGRFLNPIAFGYLVFILTFGVYINMYIFYIIDIKSIMTCCFLPWFGFIGGSVISLITVGDKKKIIAICIETGIQNTGVAIVFLRLTFPQPESDVALANPILVSMAIPIPFIILVLTRSIMNRFSFCQKFLPGKHEKNIEEKEKPEKTLIKQLLNETTNEDKQEQDQQIDRQIDNQSS
ncbi:unnamed protein product [Rotaria sordida]|uniref:Uncharacterized protein n=1 Tax=Rotaria sordida TaxID=392033 RepID=A0A813Z053_9BILA|nr:unnamed protein product [Rotaria sordida]CAF0891474.1 unnamed protein product [Rotaria sordida]